MTKRKESGMEVIASLPWQAGVVLGLIAYPVIRYGLGWLLTSSTNPFLADFGKASAAGAFTSIAWIALFACWLGALVSYFRQRHRKRLLDMQTGLRSLRSMHWKAFELIVGEAFRRQGYAVEETGLGGADGGIDLILRKQGQTVLVQCKQWRTRQVPVMVAREMFGLLVHHKADAIIIVSTGNYTVDAQRFVQGKPIELINGDQLLAMVQAVQTPAEPTQAPPAFAAAPGAAEKSDTPTCPSCGSAMVQRQNRRTREAFWGCPSYPRCKGTRTVQST
ncbi:restriction endonuclease [Dyella sedimenti]|uniref:restriction endonuclease n=1 Tax=Dyella sedimenti TaxID=2919947 RepID=UPI001FA95841|nr:restriction endonuclease [Dyella sedimenti]